MATAIRFWREHFRQQAVLWNTRLAERRRAAEVARCNAAEWEEANGVRNDYAEQRYANTLRLRDIAEWLRNMWAERYMENVICCRARRHDLRVAAWAATV